jgi:hypothetical protein
MKTLQPDSRLSLALVLALVITSAATLRAQPQLTAAQLAALQPLAPTAVPHSGTFRLLKSPYPGHPYPPLPCLPRDLPPLPIYDLGGGHLLVDDTLVDYDALR